MTDYFVSLQHQKILIKNLNIPIMANENFIDNVKIFCHSGKGGAGSAHLLRTAQDPKAGPDGGDGGKGGDVIFRGNRNLWTLLHLRYTKHIFAEDGGNGEGNQCFGKQGKNAIIEVPLGTVVKYEETGEVIGEIIEDGEELIAMNGGRGGQGNVHFKTSNTSNAPDLHNPRRGNRRMACIELKILADVACGFSKRREINTHFSHIQRKTKKLLIIRFTTLKPNLGWWHYRDHQSFVVAIFRNY